LAVVRSGRLVGDDTPPSTSNDDDDDDKSESDQSDSDDESGVEVDSSDDSDDSDDDDDEQQKPSSGSTKLSAKLDPYTDRAKFVAAIVKSLISIAYRKQYVRQIGIEAVSQICRLVCYDLKQHDRHARTIYWLFGKAHWSCLLARFRFHTKCTLSMLNRLSIASSKRFLHRILALSMWLWHFRFELTRYTISARSCCTEF
jgi:cobalamin biosynthesis protein CobT